MTKVCSCCGEAITAWSKLPLVGYQDDGKGGCFEMRNCTCCSSTLCVPLATRPKPSRRTEVAAAD